MQSGNLTRQAVETAVLDPDVGRFIFSGGPVQTQHPKQREAWRRRREQYLRDSGRHIDLIREGYSCGHPAKDWAVVAGRGERTALEQHAPGARLFVVKKGVNHVGAKVSAGARTRITTHGQREEG